MLDPFDPTALLSRLRAMPRELEAAARGLREADWRAVPAGGGFSMVEQAWHLADLEREGYAVRIRRLLEEDSPFLPDFEGDRIAAERGYRSLPMEEGLAAFAAARARNVAVLASLALEAWDRSGSQAGVGPVTLRDIPRLMLEHDDSHRAEIAALLAGAPLSAVDC